MGWRQSKTTGETLREEGVTGLLSRANNLILAGADPELDTTNIKNNSEMMKKGEERKLHRMAKVHNFFKMRQGNQNPCATQKESHTQN